MLNSVLPSAVEVPLESLAGRFVSDAAVEAVRLDTLLAGEQADLVAPGGVSDLFDLARAVTAGR
jgi:hypothetical protein